MRKLIIISIVTIMLGSGCNTNETKSTPPECNPWNISILLDLSDRITKNSSGMSQTAKDTAIINNIITKLTDKIVKNKITKSNDRIKIFFYPSPCDINNFSKTLDVDFSEINIKDKRKKLISLNSEFKDIVDKISKKAIAEGNWIGCDIWGFFDTKKVQNYCIKDNYRNVLIILSDGYIYDKNNKQKDGNKYSYILPQTLNNPNSQLLPCEKIDGDLEILFLEVDAKPEHSKRIKSIMSKWFNEMGIEKFEIHDTDLPENTKILIEKFLN